MKDRAARILLTQLASILGYAVHWDGRYQGVNPQAYGKIRRLEGRLAKLEDAQMMQEAALFKRVMRLEIITTLLANKLGYSIVEVGPQPATTVLTDSGKEAEAREENAQ